MAAEKCPNCGADLKSEVLDLGLLRQAYEAPLAPTDFVRSPAEATREINRWVEAQTCQRIRDLIPAGELTEITRLVLVNAIYLKAPWAVPFPAERTRPEAFYVRRTRAVSVPTMFHQGRFGHARQDGCCVVTLPYIESDAQFVILLPDRLDGLAASEARLTPDLLARCAQTPQARVSLHLPKFRIEPPVFRLGKALKSLGMKSAFDEPRGSADFERRAPRGPNGYLALSEAFHRTFIEVDEAETEAAAAAAVLEMLLGVERPKPPPIEVRVDHPFLFAVQHRPSGACLFLGRVTDPRMVSGER